MTRYKLVVFKNMTLDGRRVNEVSSSGYYTVRNYVIIAGHPVLL
jgi:hypothetical protein